MKKVLVLLLLGILGNSVNGKTETAAGIVKRHKAAIEAAIKDTQEFKQSVVDYPIVNLSDMRLPLAKESKANLIKRYDAHIKSLKRALVTIKVRAVGPKIHVLRLKGYANFLVDAKLFNFDSVIKDNLYFNTATSDEPEVRDLEKQMKNLKEMREAEKAKKAFQDALAEIKRTKGPDMNNKIIKLATS